jgi:hypothetical protein
MFEGLTKKIGQKNKKTKIFPRVPETRHSGKRSPSPSARARHSGKYLFFFFFLPQFFCEAFKHYLSLFAQSWLPFEFVCYISLVFPFS